MPNPKKQTLGLIIGLSVQYILGMLTTSYVEFPKAATEKIMWEFAQSQTVLVAHIFLGLFLLLSSFILLIRSFRQKKSALKIASTLGFLAIISAIYGGSEFVPTQEESYSFIMAVSFLVALLSYFWHFLTAE